ncbi:AraC family transcriptional regulator [Thalassobaculum sp.]|uniref:AraC family transcriptional regulator n=1 Tax=Thalassobaculum sp. TaxID=2022740 RepID=UPI0032EAE98C
MKPCTRSAYESRLLRVLVHIQRNLDRAMSLDELADVAAFSRFHFARIFRAMTGETVGEHVRRLKLERAAGKLRHTRQTVTEIALDAGFDTPEAFSRTFRAQFGDPPSRFRALRGSFRPPRSPSGVHYDQYGALRGFNPYQGADPMTLNVSTREFPPYPFAFLRHVGRYNDIGPVFQRVAAIADERRLFGPDTKVMMVAYDDPSVTDEQRLRSDAGVSLVDPSVETGELAKGEIAGGLYAVTVYKGPYDGLRGCYDWLMGTWLPNSGYEAADRPCVDVYLNNPADTDPEDLLTEIRVPVRRP